MEHTVLCMLDFKVSVRTSYYFATRLALAAEMTEKEQSFMFFLLGTYAYVRCQMTVMMTVQQSLYLMLPRCTSAFHRPSLC